MATYDELATLEADPALVKKVEVALWVASETIAGEDPATTNHANRLKHAKQIFSNSDSFKNQYVKYVLAANKGATLATINAASDSTVQTNVNAAIDVFADGS